MKHCWRFRKSLLAALYGEIGGKRRERFEAHLRICPGCSAKLKGMRQTLQLLELREPPDPGDGFWEAAWDKFVGEAEASRISRRESVARDRFWGLPQPRWAFQFAGAVALVLLGVWIGRFLDYGSGKGQSDVPKTAAARLPTSTGSLDDRVDRYLQRSKLILLGFSNMDLKGGDTYRFDYGPEKRVSRELVEETGILKRELEGSDEERMLELIAELEVILLQISNLQHDQEALGMELVQLGIHRSALLFQINLEEINRARRRPFSQDLRKL